MNSLQVKEVAMSSSESRTTILSRRAMLRSGVVVGCGAALALAGCDGGNGNANANASASASGSASGSGSGSGSGNPSEGSSATPTSDSCEVIPVDPSYDDGQLLYRRNDNGDANGDPSQPISEGQNFHEMIIKVSALYQTSGHMSEMETTIGPKTIIAPHKHTNAHQLVHVLGVVDPAFDFDEEGAASASYIVDLDPSQPGGIPALQFQFDVDTENPSEIVDVQVGDFIHKPANRSHSFWNSTGKRIAYVEISTGIDFEVFTRGSVNIESIAELEALEEEGNTFFSDLEFLARLMVENGIFNVKGMGGLNDAISDVKQPLALLIQQIAMQEGIMLPFDPFADLTLDTD